MVDTIPPSPHTDHPEYGSSLQSHRLRPRETHGNSSPPTQDCSGTAGNDSMDGGVEVFFFRANQETLRSPDRQHPRSGAARDGYKKGNTLVKIVSFTRSNTVIGVFCTFVGCACTPLVVHHLSPLVRCLCTFLMRSGADSLSVCSDMTQRHARWQKQIKNNHSQTMERCATAC